jgi:hypothetical protein
MRRMAVRICKNGHEVTDDGLFYCPVCRSVDLRPAGAPEPAAEAVATPVPGDEDTKRRWQRDDARERLQKVGIWGVVVYVVGIIVWFVSASSFGDSDVEGGEGGAVLGLVVGGLAASAGAAMVLVFLIGWGSSSAARPPTSEPREALSDRPRTPWG